MDKTEPKNGSGNENISASTSFTFTSTSSAPASVATTCPCHRLKGKTGWCGVAGFGVPACDH